MLQSSLIDERQDDGVTPANTDEINATSSDRKTARQIIEEDESHRLANRFGLANFKISDLQREAAEHAGLIIQNTELGQDSYVVRHKKTGDDLSAICPSYIPHDNGVFKSKDFRELLEFVAQPTVAGVNRALLDYDHRLRNVESGPKIDPKEATLTTHTVLNWLTSKDGMVGNYHESHACDHDHSTLGLGARMREIAQSSTGSEPVHGALVMHTAKPKHDHAHEHNHDHDHGSCECHAISEALQEEADAWREQIVIGAESPVNHHHPEVMIANSSISPVSGYQFNANLGVLKTVYPEGSEKAVLQASLLEKIGKSGGSVNGSTGAVYMTADQLCEFCYQIAHDPNISNHVNAALLDERKQAETKQINKNTHVFGELGLKSSDTEAQLKALAICTSALTPIVNPDLTNKLWSEFHVSHRHLAPFKEISEEFSRLDHQVQRAFEKDHLQAEDLQAIINQFPSLISFSRAFADEVGLEHISKAYDHIGVPSFDVAEDYMEPHHQKALELIRRANGTGDPPVKHAFKSCFKSIMAVINDCVEGTFESKQTFYKVSALFGAYLAVQTALTSQPVQDWMNGNNNQPEVALQVFEDEGLVDASPVTTEELIAAHAEGANIVVAQPEVERTKPGVCVVTHYHVVGTVLVPQCFFGDKLKDYNNGIIDKRDYAVDTLAMRSGLTDAPQASGSHSSNRSRQAVDKTINGSTYFNIGQYLFHILFFYSMFKRGAKHGPRAYGEAASLFGEFTNSMYSLQKTRPLLLPAIGGSLAYTITNDWDLTSVVLGAFAAGGVGNQLWKRQSEVFEQIMDAVRDVELGPQDYNALKNLENITVSIARIADIEERLPANIRGTDLSLKIAGVKQEFNVGAHNLASTLEALASFDILLKHASDKIGIEDPWQQRILGQSIEAVSNALESYAYDGDTNQLQGILDQHMSTIMAAETRHTGAPKIFRAFAQSNDNKIVEDLVERQGAQDHRRFQYGQVILDQQQKLKLGECNRFDDVVIAHSITNIVSGWDDVVETYNGVRAGYSSTPPGLRKAFWYGTGALTATSVGLDQTGTTEIFSHMLASGLDSGLNSAGDFVGLDLNVNTEKTAEVITYTLDETAGYYGDVEGFGLAMTSFAGYNIYDDIWWNDTIGGFTSLTVGMATVYYGYGKAYRPVKEIISEQKQLRMQLENTSDAAKEFQRIIDGDCSDCVIRMEGQCDTMNQLAVIAGGKASDARVEPQEVTAQTMRLG